MDKGRLTGQYKILTKEIEMMLKNIEKMGFDIRSFQDKLSDTNEVGNNYNYGQALSYDYTEQRIRELTELKNSLSSYDDYYRIYNTSKWVELKISDELTDEELGKCISEMIAILGSISKTNILDNDMHVGEQIINYSFEVAYKLIKMELYMTGQSQLYLYAQNDDICKLYFDSVIRKDIASLNLSESDSAWLNEKIFESNKKGISSSLFDIEVINRILAYQDDERIRNIVNRNINSMVDNLSENASNIDKLVASVNETNGKITKIKNDKKSNRIEFIIRFISMTLVATILTSGAFGIKKLSKKVANEKVYTKRTEIYSTINDKVTVNEEKVYAPGNTDGAVKIRVYDKFESLSSRGYKVYDVTFKDFDSLKDYYDYGVENYGVLPANYEDRYGISSYLDSYTEVERSEYEYLGKETYNFEFWISLFFFYLIYAFVVGGIEYFYFDANDETIILGNLFELFGLIKKSIDNKKDNKKLKIELSKEIRELLVLIKNNKDYKQRFDELYQNNKFLLDDKEELYRRVSEIVNQEKIADAKELVMKLR